MRGGVDVPRQIHSTVFGRDGFEFIKLAAYSDCRWALPSHTYGRSLIEAAVSVPDFAMGSPGTLKLEVFCPSSAPLFGSVSPVISPPCVIPKVDAMVNCAERTGHRRYRRRDCGAGSRMHTQMDVISVVRLNIRLCPHALHIVTELDRNSASP